MGHSSMQTTKSNSLRSPSRALSAQDSSTYQRRGRPPKKAFINVLVRTSTRAALTQLKGLTGLPSQGEVIDYLVAELGKKRQPFAQG
jgi:hypothetical protein